MSPSGQHLTAGFRWGKQHAKGRIAIWNAHGKLHKNLSLPALVVKDVNLSPDLDKIITTLIRGEHSIQFDLKDLHPEHSDEFIGHFNNGEQFGLQYQKHRDAMTFRNKQGIHSLTLPAGRYPIPTPQGNLAVIAWPGGEINTFNSTGELVSQVVYNRHGMGLPDSIVFSPDGEYFALETGRSHGGYFAVALVSMTTGKEIRHFKVEKAFSSLAIDSDSKTIAIGHKDGDISLWKHTGEKITVYQAHKGAITGLNFSHNQRFLISAGQDRVIKIQDLKHNKQLTVLILDTGAWVVFDEDGRFDSANGGRHYISFAQGTRYLNMRQTWDAFFTPGLLSQTLQGTLAKATTTLSQQFKAPNVTISPIPNSTPGKTALTVCTQAAEKAGDIFLIHNGRSIKSRGLKPVKRQNCQQFDIDLLAGENTFTGAAFNPQQTLYGRSQTLTVNYAAPHTKQPKLYLLAAGVSLYQDKNLTLKYAAADATAVAKALSHISKNLYSDVIERVLVNEQATQMNVINAMKDIQKKSQAIDTVVLFWAGHGDTIDSTYYFLGHDADITNLKKSALSITDLAQFTKGLKANKVLILLDTCKSGQATQSLQNIAFARDIEERKWVANLAKERGIAVFSAASKTQSAFEVESLGHGIFTHSLIESLNKHPQEISNGKLISVAKLLSFVNRKTRDIAQTYLNTPQHPILYIFGDDFSLGLLE